MNVPAWQGLSIGFALATALFFTGCANGPNSTPNQPLAITVQPLSQTVPIGQTATFSVTATGTAPLNYQWSENGAEISGATGASYTTPAVALGNGSSTSVGSFEVTVSNASGSVTSESATLSAGPRSPKAGDLRYLLYQQVNVPKFSDSAGSGSGDIQVAPGQIISHSDSNALGTPIEMGSSNLCQGGTCVWQYGYNLLPPPITGYEMYYQGGLYSNFVSDMQSFAALNVVFTSLDLEPSENAYAVSWVKTAQTGGFDYRMDPMIPPGADQQAQIQAQATLDGTESRVITAVSFDASGNALLISYGWTGDTTTVYETQAVLVPVAGDIRNEVLSAATTLANNGYIISAFGGNDTDGYVLIGMRVQGDSLPRSINNLDIINNDTQGQPYFTRVATIHEFTGETIVNEQ